MASWATGGRLICLVVLLIASLSDAMVQEGRMDYPKGGAKFIAKFCFAKTGDAVSTAASQLLYKIRVPENNGNNVLVILDDKVWTELWKEGPQNCMTLTSLKEGHGFLSQLIDTKTTNPQETSCNGVLCEVQFNNTRRPHFWYFALANCDKPILADYHLTWRNPGTIFSREFSYDQQGLPQEYLVFMIAFCAMAIIHWKGVRQLRQANSWHPIVKLLTIAILLQTASVTILWIHYTIYMFNGQGLPSLYGFGDFLDMISQVVLMMLLFLLAKGWAITHVSIQDRSTVLTVTGIFMLLYTILFIWEMHGVDPATTYYIYESMPGIFLLLIRSVSMLWFVASIYQTYQVEDGNEKKSFYKWFGVGSVVWFFTLPGITIISTMLDPWSRFITVNTMYLVVNFLGMGSMAVLLWPTRAGDYFKIAPLDVLSSSAPYSEI